MNLVIPKAGSAIAADQLMRLERKIANIILKVSEFETLEEWRAKARALEMYLRDKELQRPMLGAQRRIEARLWQLLGEPIRGRPKISVMSEIKDKDDRTDFRVLAHALEGKLTLSEDEWRKSRRALVSFIRHKRCCQKPRPLPEGIFRCVTADPLKQWWAKIDAGRNGEKAS